MYALSLIPKKESESPSQTSSAAEASTAFIRAAPSTGKCSWDGSDKKKALVVCHIDFKNWGFLLELHIERRALVFLPTHAQPSKLDRLLNRPSKGRLGGDESWDSSLTARVALPTRQPHATQGKGMIKAFLI